MIRQTFGINNQIILTIFHKNFIHYPKSRIIEQHSIFGDYEFVFKECWCEDNYEIKYDIHNSKFLEIENEQNPYSNLCCIYEEYINIHKNSICNELLKDLLTYQELCEFVLEYSGFNLLKSPLSINNILVFSKTPISIKKYNKDGIVTIFINKSFECELLINIKYKVGTSIVRISSFKTKENSITFPDKDNWNLFDIEIFLKDAPVYIEHDISWIESLQFSMNVVTNKQEIDLRREKRSVSLEQHSSDLISMGKPVRDDLCKDYSYQNQILKSKLNKQLKFELLTENEYARALDIFKEITSNPTFTELWIFDPYFTDVNGGFDKNHDIMVILSTNLNMKKNIIYEQGKGNLDQYKKSIEEVIKIFSESHTPLRLIGTRKHFHDRFIFLKNSRRVLGYQLGTSFNSFGENYSTIAELTPFDSKYVFEILSENLLQDDQTIIEKLVDE